MRSEYSANLLMETPLGVSKWTLPSRLARVRRRPSTLTKILRLLRR